MQNNMTKIYVSNGAPLRFLLPTAEHEEKLMNFCSFAGKDPFILHLLEFCYYHILFLVFYVLLKYLYDKVLFFSDL